MRRTAILAALILAFAGPARAADVTVFAAASLRDALGSIAAGWSKETGRTVAVSYGASSALARQIEAGAPADLFASADTGWMDHLAARGLIREGTRADLLGNELVLIVPAASPVMRVTLAGGTPLDPRLFADGGRLALADPRGVPAGRYARAALESLGLWREAEPRLAPAANARAALALVARGEAGAGVVYRTDAIAEPRVRVAASFPEGSHPPIVYSFALMAGAREGAPAAFLAHLRGPAAADAFRRQGFRPLAPAATP